MKFPKAADILYGKLVEENGAYYRKRKVYPYLKRDGSVSWFNAITGGRWLNIFILVIVLVIVLGFIYEYSSNMEICNEIVAQKNQLKQAINFSLP